MHMRTPWHTLARFPLARLYATVGATTTASASEAPDPHRWPTHPHPTPYDILETRRGGKYSQARYAELVKLYHPDHAIHHAHACPAHVRQERFRLVLAAHGILKDRSRRALYDRCGAGWHAGAGTTGHSHPVYRPWWDARAREGHGPPPSQDPACSAAYGRGGTDDCSHNATWEDWEQWRSERSGDAALRRQRELHARNGVFMGGVLILACLASWVELGYVSHKGEESVQVLDRNTETLGRDIQKRQVAAAGLSDRDDGVRRFLLMRDPERLLREKEVTRAEREMKEEGRAERRRRIPPPRLIDDIPPPTPSR